MLIEFKIKSQLTICYWSRFVLHGEEQVFHIPFYQERASDYSHDFVDIASDFHFMFNNRNQAISADSHIYLYPYGILRLSPKSSDTQVLFYPLEEQFHLPSVFVKEYYLFGREDEVVGIECECPIQIRNISYYSSDSIRIILCIALSNKPNGLVFKYVTIAFNINTCFYSVFRLSLFSDYKESVDLIDVIETAQIPVPTIKYISCLRFIFNDIHCVDIVGASFCYVDHLWNLGNNVKLGMKLYARFCTSKISPLENTHAKIYRRRIKRIEFSFNTEFSPNSGTLSHIYHMISEFFKDMPVSIRVAFGKNRTVYSIFTETEMKRLFFMRHGYVRQFTETTAAIKLPEHKNEQLIPIRQLPSQCWVCNLVFYATRHDSFKFSFWQKVSYLAENISSCIHVKANMRASPNIANSKVRQGIGYLNVA